MHLIGSKGIEIGERLAYDVAAAEQETAFLVCGLVLVAFGLVVEGLGDRCCLITCLGSEPPKLGCGLALYTWFAPVKLNEMKNGPRPLSGKPEGNSKSSSTLSLISSLPSSLLYNA